MSRDDTVTDPAVRRRPPAEARLAVLVAAWTPDPRHVGARRTLASGEVLAIGRGGADLVPGVLDDPLLSRRHARLVGGPAGARLEDLGSHNGTRVDGVRATAREVGDGAVIAFGDQVWVLRLGPPDEPDPTSSWRGAGPAAAALHAAIAAYAPAAGTVLVTGETGTGKELVAREVHARSGRPGPFVPAAATGVGDALLLAELMGHERGAFTGADRARTGLARAAEGGTLFLDEIGDASPAFQAALLRLLEEGEVRPVGADRPVRARARVIAATHRDLAAEVAAGRFRADLHARLDHLPVRVPALRERPEDLGLLAHHLLAPSGRRPSRAAVEALFGARFPGNVRELRARLERAAATSRGPEVDLPQAAPAAPAGPPEDLAALLAEAGSVPALARRLGIGRSTAYRRLEAAGLRPGRGRA